VISTEMTQGVFLYILFDRFLDFDWALPVHPSDSALIAALMTAFFFFLKDVISFPYNATTQWMVLSNVAACCFDLHNRTVFMAIFPTYIF